MHLYLLAGRGRQMDSYVDDLFDPVLDEAPPVSDVINLSFKSRESTLIGVSFGL